MSVITRLLDNSCQICIKFKTRIHRIMYITIELKHVW